MLLVEFLAFFAFILVFGYLLPAGQFYYRFYVRRKPADQQLRIQDRWPLPGQIRREFKLSLITVAIWATMSTVLFELYKAGHTSIYSHINDYPLWYLPVSFVLCVVLHDTYFYWTHRFMHWRPVFKYFHLAHHRSIAPTPWAIYAFSPLEAVTQFIGIMLLVIFLPLWPMALLAFLSYDTLVNTAGHTGYEVVPLRISKRPLMKYFNTVTHHDAHHTNVRVNYGSFFNIWDRWMGTFQDDSTPGPHHGVKHPAMSADNKQSDSKQRLPAAWSLRSNPGVESGRQRRADTCPTSTKSHISSESHVSVTDVK